MKMDNIIMESDSQVTIGSIMDKIVAPKQICDLVDDIKSVARNIKNLSFTYYSRSLWLVG